MLKQDHLVEIRNTWNRIIFHLKPDKYYISDKTGETCTGTMWGLKAEKLLSNVKLIKLEKVYSQNRFKNVLIIHNKFNKI